MQGIWDGLQRETMRKAKKAKDKGLAPFVSTSKWGKKGARKNTSDVDAGNGQLQMVKEEGVDASISRAHAIPLRQAAPKMQAVWRGRKTRARVKAEKMQDDIRNDRIDLGLN